MRGRILGVILSSETLGGARRDRRGQIKEINNSGLDSFDINGTWEFFNSITSPLSVICKIGGWVGHRYHYHIHIDGILH